VALAGLVGAGRSELARAIFGAVPAVAAERTAGTVRLSGTPRGSLDARMAMIPESRKDEGLLLRRPVRENVSLAGLRDLGQFGFVRRRLEAGRVREALSKAAASSGLETIPAALSGGNQQKLLFARAVLAQPGILIADEPTRGVDVGAKRDLYELLVGLAASGVAILLISNEIEEILGLAHRVLVMRGGRLVAELVGERMTEEAILAASFGRVAGTA
jgi:rhamnose transport system ATP-binding protein